MDEARRGLFAEMYNLLDIVERLLTAGDVERVRLVLDVVKTNADVQRRVATQLRKVIEPALAAERFEITEELLNEAIPTQRKLRVDFAKVDERTTQRVRACLERILAHADFLE
jgi:hypothetical protein